MVTYSKVFGPTDSVAGTLTQVGSTYIIKPGSWVINKIIVGKGNVVNAKECAGKITITVAGTDGTYIYAYGNGAGGATNSGNGPAEPIECEISAKGGSEVKVYVTDAEIAKDVTVSLEFKSGGGRVDSYATGGAGSDTTADTELALTAIKPTKPGSIKQIRIAGSGVVDAKAGSGKLILDVPGLDGPFEYAFGNGPGGATLSGPAWADVFNVDIPVTENTSITPKVTTAEIMLSVTVSLAIR